MAEDSLSRRLAGQSVNKAGLGNDQTEINRIIMESSKGSKFYEAERKKDAELTEKINRLLAQKDSMMSGVDIARVEAGVDNTLAELEESRDLTQYICHVDCDAFYASVELLDRPELAGKAFGVGHGILCTASYEARKFGVRSAMPSFIAKKLCPELILVELHFDRYAELSRQVMSILRVRDPNMATMSMDEAYLNITEYCELNDLTPEECVQQMRAEVQEKTKLTVSAGIAPNKMLAKICSDKNKPNGQYMMPFRKEDITEFMYSLPIRKVPGIGKVRERLLESFDIKTCGDIFVQRATICVMDHHFGLHSLLQSFLGIASNDVQPGKREERKSVGAERTFKPIDDTEELLDKLEQIAQSLAEDMEHGGWAAKTITLKYKLDTYKVYTRAKSCSRYITSKEDLFAIGKELFLKVAPLKLRLIGLRATQLKDLRASDESGIRKFFAKSDGQVGGVSSASPLRKRRKIGDPEYITISDDEESSFLVLEEKELVKASFFDSDDDDASIVPIMHLPKTVTEKPKSAIPSSSHLPPLLLANKRPRSISIGSAPVPSSSVAKQSRSVPKPVSALRENDTRIGRATETLMCPICSKHLMTDNAGLNAHIDFCLSKGEIWKASAEGAGDFGGTRPSTSNGGGRKKNLTRNSD